MKKEAELTFQVEDASSEMFLFPRMLPDRLIISFFLLTFQFPSTRNLFSDFCTQTYEGFRWNEAVPINKWFKMIQYILTEMGKRYREDGRIGCDVEIITCRKEWIRGLIKELDVYLSDHNLHVSKEQEKSTFCDSNVVCVLSSISVYIS